MVKHAAEERVNAAVERVTAGRDLRAERQRWMEYIRLHLVRSLDEAFATADVLAQHVTAASRYIERTPRAVLAKAFRGELLPVPEIEGAA
jgi:hypothetical protein